MLKYIFIPQRNIVGGGLHRICLIGDEHHDSGLVSSINPDIRAPEESGTEP
jgi:hypothetical protein